VALARRLFVILTKKHYCVSHIIMGLVSKEATLEQRIAGPYSNEVRELQLGLAQVVHANRIKQTINLLPSPDTLPN
jgi:hypothetical protein